jgi:hypothetical protein
LVLVTACGSDLSRHTRAFVPMQRCSQGPFDLHFAVDGKTAEEGIEIVACTPRRLAGHVSVAVNDLPFVEQAFGAGADNARCVAAPGAVVAATAPASGGGASAAGGASGSVRPGAALAEAPYRGGESPFEDEVCGKMGLVAQTLLMPTVWRGDGEMFAVGADIHVRVWSDAPNDLDGVVFLVRQLTSNRSRAAVKKEYDELEKRPVKRDAAPAPRVEAHGPPPPPLPEATPPTPAVEVEWVPGYWTWTGSAWGWVAGFWRDARFAMPAPRVEVPGAPPGAGAVWIGGGWRRDAGSWIWIGGRWRLP